MPQMWQVCRMAPCSNPLPPPHVHSRPVPFHFFFFLKRQPQPPLCAHGHCFFDSIGADGYSEHHPPLLLKKAKRRMALLSLIAHSGGGICMPSSWAAREPGLPKKHNVQTSKNITQLLEINSTFLGVLLLNFPTSLVKEDNPYA